MSAPDYRSKQLRKIARQLDLEYQPEDNYDLTEQLGDFRLFRRGGRKRITNVLRHQEDLMSFDIRMFDYRYLKWNGSKMQPYQQTVFYLESTQLGLPELWLQPETLFHKLGELFGRGDIDFVRFPSFSGQYRLTGEDEAYIRHHFTDQLLNYFTVEKGWSLEGVGYFMILYRKERLMAPEHMAAFYKRGLELFRMLKTD